jgi:predicted permease
MIWTRVLAARLRGLAGRRRVDRELDEELRFHLEMRIEDNLRSGMQPGEARHAALRDFGGVESVKEQYRERSSIALIETTLRDIRYALRTFRRSPGYSAAAIAVLALAIGANTAMFSVLHALLIEPLPYEAPDELVMLWTEAPSQGVREGRTAYRDIEQWQRLAGSFSGIAFFDPCTLTLTTSTETHQVSAARISPNLFELLGVQPRIGRMFTPREAAERQRLVLISHRFWQTHFAGSETAIGSLLELDGKASQVAGVMPPSFLFAEVAADVWEPYTLFPDWDTIRGAATGSWFAVGRLRRGVNMEQAQAEMNAVAQRIAGEAPSTARGRGVSVVPLSLQVVRPHQRLALWMLAGAVFLVLIIAAANVAGLSLARAAGREREIAIRSALGAGRLRIVRQLLAESVTLAAIAGLLGVLLAHAGLRAILVFKPVELARLDEASLNLEVLGWAAAICLLTGVLAGLAPAITLARRHAGVAGQRPGLGVARGVRRALVVTEFALAITLLAGAGLLVRSLWLVQNVDLGFHTDRVLSAQISTPPQLDPSRRPAFYDRILEEIESLPGVESAAMVGDLFIGGNAEQAITIEGDGNPEPARLRFRLDEASSGFFATLGVPLLRGRLFNSGDGPDDPRVALINETMAHRLWPGRDPIGRRFKLGEPESAAPWYTVAGIAGDMRRQGIESDPIPQIFEPLAQNPSRLATLLVRTTAADPLALAGAVRAAVRRVERHAPLYMVTSLEQRRGDFLAQRRFQTLLLTGFSIVALLMAVIGIYGLIQYSVATRTPEIGIRMAIGAQAGEIFRMVIREGLALCLAGLIIGLAGALWLSHAGSALLYGVAATDPLTFAAVSLLLIATGAAACYVPARRAMKIEPLAALRAD